jgi:hypothetical protein
MSVIAGQGGGPYGAAMAAAVLRLLALVALVLMPLGMAGAPAIAQQMPMDHAAMAMGGGHCDEQPEQDKAPASKMDCAAMCTALPAADAPAPAPRLKLAAPLTITIVVPFAGIEPEIATPPPRQA